MHILEITVQRQNEGVWPVVIEHSYPGDDLPTRREGHLQLDENKLLTKIRPHDYGRVLGEALFHGPIRDVLTNALSAAGDGKLRILLHIEAAPLRTLRWERLSAPFDDGWGMLLLNQRTLFAHYMPSLTDRRFPPFGRRDLRALVLVASPKGLEKYNLSHFDAIATAEHIREALGEIPCDLLVNDMEGAVGPATPKALAYQLTTQRYTLVHFVAHGQFSRIKRETALFLADEQNQVNRVDGDQMLENLKSLQPEHGFPHFAFLGTCDSAAPEAENVMGGMAQRLVRDLGIPTVLAMTEQISIETLQALTTKFYARLREHGEADRALVEAATTVETRFHDAVVPALYTRLEGRPLFSDDLTRPLTDSDVRHGLDRMETLLVQRAPILLSRFKTIADELRITPTAPQHLREVGQLCQETLDISFPALAMDRQAPPYDDRCPFQGLSTFTREDQGFFFGRSELVQELSAKLNHHPFLTLHGPSGSGKSSLILAGLIPLLQDEQGGKPLEILYVTPGNTPLQTLTDLLTLMPRPDVIFVDQFEELFTLCASQKQRTDFVDYLYSLYLGPAHSGLESIEETAPEESAPDKPLPRLLSSVPNIGLTKNLFKQTDINIEDEPMPTLDYEPIIIVALREDFWDDCESLPRFYSLMEAYHRQIEPMDAIALRSAMEQQASAVGLRFEADLSHTILDDVASEPGAMPLLQHGLRELWENRHGRWLRTSEYRRIGGIRQTIARKAEHNYSSFSQQEQTLMKHLMLRLIRLDNDAEIHEQPRDTRQRALQAELTPSGYVEADLQSLVGHLANKSLIITRREPVKGRDGIAIAHEALITYWDRLQDWLNTDRGDLLQRQKLSDTVRSWQANGQDGGFLYRGQLLTEALQLAKQKPAMLNATEHDFLHRSQRRKWMRWLLTGIAACLAIVLIFLLLFRGSPSPELPQITFDEVEALENEQVLSLVWLDDEMYVGLLPKNEIAYGDDLKNRQEVGVGFVREIIADPTNPDAFYTLSGNSPPTHIITGETPWSMETIILPTEVTDVRGLAVSPTGTLYIGDGEKPVIYRCESYPCDDSTWLSTNHPDMESAVRVMRWLDQSERLLVGTAEYVWELEENVGWNRELIGGDVYDVIEYQHNDKQRLFVGSDRGITLFEDSVKKCPFERERVITSMTLFDKGSEPIVVAGTKTGRLLWWFADEDQLCVDEADSIVTELDFGKEFYIATIDFDPNPPHELWVGTAGGLFVGETEKWRDSHAR